MKYLILIIFFLKRVDFKLRRVILLGELIYFILMYVQLVLMINTHNIIKELFTTNHLNKLNLKKTIFYRNVYILNNIFYYSYLHKLV